MLPRAGHLLSALALGTLAVPVCALKFNITEVQQCGSVAITFFGSNLTTPPTFLTIIPLDSNAIVVPLQNPALISTGIALTFLPLAAGSNFLASLDDGGGDNVITISDLIRVLPSSDANSSCLPDPENETPRHFTIEETVSQCEDFTITYDVAAVAKAPSVRLYSPRGPSFLLNNTSDDSATGVATYTMNFTRGGEVVLLMDDGSTIRETSPLLTVGGDSSSSKSCFIHNNSNTTSNTTGATASNTPLASKAVIIGAAVGGVAILLIALGMIIFVIRDRRKRRNLRNQAAQFDPSAMEKAADNNEKRPAEITRFIARSPRIAPMAGMVSNPIYTTSSFLSVEKSSQLRGSMASWAQVVPEDQRYRSPPSARSSDAISPTMPTDNSNIVVIPPETPQRPDRSSLESLDIEGMLNMASLQSDNTPGSRKNSDVNPFGPILRAPSLTVPDPTFIADSTNRRHNRDPSDVPAGPGSIRFSGYSVSPSETRDNTFQEPLRTGDSLRSPGGVGLPRSPRTMGVGYRLKVSSGMSRASSSDWYGIAS